MPRWPRRREQRCVVSKFRRCALLKFGGFSVELVCVPLHLVLRFIRRESGGESACPIGQFAK